MVEEIKNVTLAEAKDELLAAIRRAVDEHGAPNAFYLVELEGEYGAPNPMLSGRVLRVYGEISTDELIVTNNGRGKHGTTLSIRLVTEDTFDNE